MVPSGKKTVSYNDFVNYMLPRANSNTRGEAITRRLHIAYNSDLPFEVIYAISRIL